MNKLTNTAANHSVIWFIDWTVRLKSLFRKQGLAFLRGCWGVLVWGGGGGVVFNYQSVFLPRKKHHRGKHHSLLWVPVAFSVTYPSDGALTVLSCPSPAPFLMFFTFSFNKIAQVVEVVLGLAAACLHILLRNRWWARNISGLHFQVVLLFSPPPYTFLLNSKRVNVVILCCAERA